MKHANATEEMFEIERRAARDGWHFLAVGKRHGWPTILWRRVCLFTGIVFRETQAEYRMMPRMAWEIARSINDKPYREFIWQQSTPPTSTTE